MTWVIIVLAVLAAAVIAAVAIQRARSSALRRRLGPEYERMVDEHGDRREAESEMRERVKQRDAIELTDLSPTAREWYVTEWRTVQARFVDEPDRSIDEAERLIDQVAADRGYRAGTPDQSAVEGDAAGERAAAGGVERPDDDVGDRTGDRLDMVAIDHPSLVEDYRAAHAAVRRDGRGEGAASIDDLRAAFIRYRALFDELVAGDDGGDRGHPTGVSPTERV